MFKLNQANRNGITSIIVMILLIVALALTRNASAYQPRPIRIKTVSEASIFDLKSKIECVAGGGKDDEVYSMGLTPGGLCGAQKLVADHAGYAIEDGIGGSLI
tara:strand:- start:3328 stop:3636 length:309 start_codon:yes stop_codon:yes gene_type:complete